MGKIPENNSVSQSEVRSRWPDTPGRQLNFHGDLQLLAQPRTFAAWAQTGVPKGLGGLLETPFGGPEHVLRYLGRCTHRVAHFNHAWFPSLSEFRWRDSAHNNEQKLLTLAVDEFFAPLPELQPHSSSALHMAHNSLGF